jgi:hypothetical protein
MEGDKYYWIYYVDNGDVSIVKEKDLKLLDKKISKVLYGKK